MWFKNIQIFQYQANKLLDVDSIENQLDALTFEACPSSHPSSYGWVPPINQESAQLIQGGNGYWVICLRIEEKILPPAVVSEMLNEKISAIESAQGRKVAQKEKYHLKDEIVQTLLPQAFSKHTRIYAYIDSKNHWLILDTIRPKHLEIFLNAIKKTLPQMLLVQFKIEQLHTQMTRWIQNEHLLPQGFIVEQSCVLQDINNQGRVIRCTKQDLSAQPIQTLLNDGCEVQQLALFWQDRVQFTLTSEFILKSIKFSDEIREFAKSDTDDGEAHQFNADFVIMTQTLAGLLEQLLKVCGHGHKDKSIAKKKAALT